MNRTQEEIVARMEEIKDRDFFGHQRSDLLDYLDFEHAKPYLKEGVTPEQWEEVLRDTMSPNARMIDYMSFAWEKANGERGLSAARTMDHYTSWLWLDGDETLHKTLENYTEYGKPQLREICEYLGVNSTDFGDEK